jgi:endonuclease/exonuclease/phosphatase (EEP) superfamily protein YafD
MTSPNDLVELSLDNGTFSLFCLHSPRPLNNPTYNYVKFWQKVVPALAAEPGPLVVVGDFNATQHSRVYRDLTSGGLRSAHADRGRGYVTTWPNGQYLAPPIRIDHTLLSPTVECLRIAEGIGRGSDHKPLIVDLRVHQ